MKETPATPWNRGVTSNRWRTANKSRRRHREWPRPNFNKIVHERVMLNRWDGQQCMPASP
jgi:hypothetical protein